MSDTIKPVMRWQSDEAGRFLLIISHHPAVIGWHRKPPTLFQPCHGFSPPSSAYCTTRCNIGIRRLIIIESEFQAYVYSCPNARMIAQSMSSALHNYFQKASCDTSLIMVLEEASPNRKRLSLPIRITRPVDVAGRESRERAAFANRSHIPL
jgi:hypothetical protein